MNGRKRVKLIRDGYISGRTVGVPNYREGGGRGGVTGGWEGGRTIKIERGREKQK